MRRRIRVSTERRRLRLSEDKFLFGVCGGIGEFFDISPNVVRLIFIFTNAGSVLVYLILAIYLNGDHFFDFYHHVLRLLRKWRKE